MSPTKRKIFLGQVAYCSLVLIAAAGMFFIMRSLTACWQLTALPGMPPAYCTAKSQEFASEPVFCKFSATPRFSGVLLGKQLACFANHPQSELMAAACAYLQ